TPFQHTTYIPLSLLMNHPSPTQIYTLSLHDALPIYAPDLSMGRRPGRPGGHRPDLHGAEIELELAPIERSPPAWHRPRSGERGERLDQIAGDQWRSEERRVGREWSAGWWREGNKKRQKGE